MKVRVIGLESDLAANAKLTSEINFVYEMGTTKPFEIVRKPGMSWHNAGQAMGFIPAAPIKDRRFDLIGKLMDLHTKYPLTLTNVWSTCPRSSVDRATAS